MIKLQILVAPSYGVHSHLCVRIVVGHTFLSLGLLDCLVDPKALATKHDNIIVFAQQPIFN